MIPILVIGIDECELRAVAATRAACVAPGRFGLGDRLRPARPLALWVACVRKRSASNGCALLASDEPGGALVYPLSDRMDGAIVMPEYGCPPMFGKQRGCLMRLCMHAICRACMDIGVELYYYEFPHNG